MSQSHETVLIASLLASRLCHDLVNPVGALNTGLEVFNDPDGDPEMQTHAAALIRESTDKTIAILSYARIAYGSSGAFEGEIDMLDAAKLAAAYFSHVKADLNWEVALPMMPKPRARTLLNILLIAERAVPRAGSAVTVQGTEDGARIIAKGPKVKFSDEVRRAVTGEIDELQAKETPAYLAYLLASAGGDVIDAYLEDEETLVFDILPAH